jgi:hypothetical protein
MIGDPSIQAIWSHALQLGERWLVLPFAVLLVSSEIQYLRQFSDEQFPGAVFSRYRPLLLASRDQSR